MRCAHCQHGEMRLVRFQQRQEVFACRECEAESVLLDCHYCERRTVRRLPDSENGNPRWACHRCQLVQHKCPQCHQGWVVADAILTPLAKGFSCQSCQYRWGTEADIG